MAALQVGAKLLGGVYGKPIGRDPGSQGPLPTPPTATYQYRLTQRGLTYTIAAPK
jgi:hypothetical protein